MIFDDFTIAMMLMMGVGVCLLIAAYFLEKTVKEDKPDYPASNGLAFDSKPKTM